MDTILAVLGLALAIASLVPSFTSKNVRMKIIGLAISLSLIGVLGALLYWICVERSRIDHTKGDITRMFANNRPMSFEQIYSELNYIDYSTAAAAVDELVDEHAIHHRPV